MLDPNATVDIVSTRESISDCGHEECCEKELGSLLGCLVQRETRGPPGAWRRQHFRLACYFPEVALKCSVSRVFLQLSLPTRDADGNITGSRYVAQTTHTITHRNPPKPEPKTTGARAFTVTELRMENGQRPWLRVVEAPTIVHCSAQNFPVTLETNIMDPDVRIEYVSRDCDGKDIDDLDLYPDQDRLDWMNELLLRGYFSPPTTRGQKGNATRRYKMDGFFDILGRDTDKCDSWRVIFTAYKVGKSRSDREVLAVASHNITLARQE